jgi:D-hydroxyproline dehydrogenase subunit gamma
MNHDLDVVVNGRLTRVPHGASAAAAIAIAGDGVCRTSVGGEARAPLCGMGICLECRATVNGRPHVRTCQVECVPGMEIRTHG